MALPSSPAPATASQKAVAFAARLKRLLPALSLFALCVFFSARAPKSFPTLENGFSLTNQYAYLLLMAIGATVIILTGGIDLSVGSVLALSGIVSADLMVNHHAPVWVGLLAGVGCGAVAGLVNALVITRLKVPAFIATLGMQLVARGLALRIARGVTIDNVPEGFNHLASGRAFGVVPLPLLLIVVVALVVAFLLRATVWGRYVYAVGANANAARMGGVPVERVSLWAYVLGGLLAGLAGMVETARLGSGNPTGGSGYELDVITAVVVGGASLTGGEGRISGTLLGAFLIAVLHNGANILGVDPFDQSIYIGLLIVGAVSFDQWLKRARR